MRFKSALCAGHIGLMGLLLLGGPGCGLFSRSPATHGSQQLEPPKPPPPVPRARNEPIDQDLRIRAKAELIARFNDSDPAIRANAVEAAQDTLGDGAKAIVMAGLNDADPDVRFSSLMAAGTLRLSELHAQALTLAGDSNVRVQLAARYALHQFGDTHLSHEFEKYARDPRADVRGNTAFVLGLLGNKTAIRPLVEMRHGELDPDVRLAVAEALWRLGDDRGLETLVGFMSSVDVGHRLVAMIAVTAPKNSMVEGHLQGNLTDDIPEIALVATRCLGTLGSPDGYAIAVKYVKDPDPRIRLLAAAALGAIGRSDAQNLLAPMLQDADPRVRLAAADAILELKEP